MGKVEPVGGVIATCIKRLLIPSHGVFIAETCSGWWTPIIRAARIWTFDEIPGFLSIVEGFASSVFRQESLAFKVAERESGPATAPLEIGVCAGACVANCLRHHFKDDNRYSERFMGEDEDKILWHSDISGKRVGKAISAYVGQLAYVLAFVEGAFTTIGRVLGALECLIECLN
jgi:hypothetical protein